MEAIITLWTLSDPHNAPIHSGYTRRRPLALVQTNSDCLDSTTGSNRQMMGTSGRI